MEHLHQAMNALTSKVVGAICYMDQELGGQTVVGRSPCMLEALTGLPEGSAIRV